MAAPSIARNRAVIGGVCLTVTVGVCGCAAFCYYGHTHTSGFGFPAVAFCHQLLTPPTLKMSSDGESTRSPVLPNDSDHGSSVSSDFQDEYDQLLRYAVVTPKFGSHFLREHQTTAEQTTSDRFSSPRESEQEQAAERSQTSSSQDLHQQSNREIERDNPATEADHHSASRSQTEQIAFQRSPFASVLEAFSPVHSEEMSLHGSSSSSTRSQVEQVRVTELPIPAEDLQQVEDLLELWSGGLK
ncbi:PREDICTED: centrosomal protein POC5-like, partial [Nanorana parkeri]|uniref:centrosomal protein POC5-like n=1 Tax=Nanorana parkeri TaxID=125878 RepID=UPI000854CB71